MVSAIRPFPHPATGNAPFQMLVEVFRPLERLFKMQLNTMDGERSLWWVRSVEHFRTRRAAGEPVVGDQNVHASDETAEVTTVHPDGAGVTYRLNPRYPVPVSRSLQVCFPGPEVQ